MNNASPLSLRTVERASFWAITVFLIGIIYFGLSTVFITVLFGYLVIEQLGKRFSKGWATCAFAVLATLLFYIFLHFLTEAMRALPSTAEKSIPIIVDFANRQGVDIPFNDAGTLKLYIVDEMQSQLAYVAKFAQLFTKEFVYVIIGLVVTCGVFLQREIDLGRHTYSIQNNVYTGFTDALSERYRRFYNSFRTVMGAQVLISLVNTFFTGMFLVLLSILGSPLPYSFVIVVVTFLCGLLPIIGNLISNTVIFFIGLSQSITLGVASLTYLIVLHKFEYFLNSKIIGGKIKNPMWLTLVGLLIGERLGGVPGMILAPVVLRYIKIEASNIPTTAPPK